jgi:hypothetical protein
MSEIVGYALAVSAMRSANGKVYVPCGARFVSGADCNSHEEAIGIGVEMALDEWPPEEEWYSHRCAVQAVRWSDLKLDNGGDQV